MKRVEIKLLFFSLFVIKTGGGASSGPGGPRTWGPGEVEEIEEALIVLGVILMCFICICAAQIYQRAKYELVHTSKEPRSMPVAPYTREASTV